MRGGESPYDAIARLYDPWSRSVTEDVDFYVEEAVAAGGPVVELGVGTGRIAVPVALAGVAVIGVDSSAAMLEVCTERAAAASAAQLVLCGRLLQLRNSLAKPLTELVVCGSLSRTPTALNPLPLLLVHHLPPPARE